MRLFVLCKSKCMKSHIRTSYIYIHWMKLLEIFKLKWWCASVSKSKISIHHFLYVASSTPIKTNTMWWCTTHLKIGPPPSEYIHASGKMVRIQEIDGFFSFSGIAFLIWFNLKICTFFMSIEARSSTEPLISFFSASHQIGDVINKLHSCIPISKKGHAWK